MTLESSAQRGHRPLAPPMAPTEAGGIEPRTAIRHARGHACALAVAAAVAGCAALEVKQDVLDTAQAVRKGPETAPFRPITSFSEALRCMDNLMITYNIRDLSILVEELADATKKVNAGTRDMLISAVSDMTRRSRAIRLVAYGQDAGNAISFLQQAERKHAYASIPQFDIKGSISQFDENVAKKDASLGGAIGELLNLGVGRTGSATILGVDLTVLHLSDLSIVPGVTSKNAALILKQGTGFDGDAQYRKFGINYTTALSRAEGNAQALRNLIELGVIEIFGRLTKVPYWQCLGATADSADVKREIADWYFAMTGNPVELIAYFQNQLSARGFYQGPVDGEGNEAIAEAVARYRVALGLPEGSKIDQEFFTAYLDADHAAIQKKHAGAKPSVAKVAEQPSASTGEAPQPDNPPSSKSAGARPPAGKPIVLALRAPGADKVHGRGEPVRFSLQPSRDAYVYCFLRDDTDTVMRFFPNRFVKDPLVRSGQSLEIPGKMQFLLHASERGRSETVACFGAPREVLGALPPALKAGDFEPMSGASLEEIHRAFAALIGDDLGLASLDIRSK